MKNFIKQRGMSLKIKTIEGILVLAPKHLRGEDIDFLLIAEDNNEYQLSANDVTFQMWSLVDGRVQVSGFLSESPTSAPKLRTTTFKCIETFVEDHDSILAEFDDPEFDIAHFDFAI